MAVRSSLYSASACFSVAMKSSQTLLHEGSLGAFTIKRGLCLLPGLDGAGAPKTHLLVRRHVPFGDLGLEIVRFLEHPGKIARTRNLVEGLDSLVKSRLLVVAQVVVLRQVHREMGT